MEQGVRIAGAHHLEGRVLNERWTVVQRIPMTNTTGGHFSVAYLVRDADGRLAFAKALDASDALDKPDWVERVNRLTNAYLFERDLVLLCGERRMTRVVRALDRGEVEMPGMTPPSVHFLVFELANGDVRTALSDFEQFDIAWALRALHHAATGLKQLHYVGVAHQDLKPSNLLAFEDDGVFKLADLGRASRRDRAAEHDALAVAGDLQYAPPELLYGFVSGEWSMRRTACDVYLLGSMAMFLFAGVTATAQILGRVPAVMRPRSWQGAFDDVLPHLLGAFNDAVAAFAETVPEGYREPVVEAVRQLCMPDPRLRGHPRSRRNKANPYGLDRYESLFNHLANRAELGLPAR